MSLLSTTSTANLLLLAVCGFYLHYLPPWLWLVSKPLGWLRVVSRPPACHRSQEVGLLVGAWEDSACPPHTPPQCCQSRGCLIVSEKGEGENKQ